MRYTRESGHTPQRFSVTTGRIIPEETRPLTEEEMAELQQDGAAWRERNLANRLRAKRIAGHESRPLTEEETTWLQQENAVWRERNTVDRLRYREYESEFPESERH